jgi:hypothetical protein
MPKHKKIWKSEDQILKKIDQARYFAQRKAKQSEEHKALADALALEAQVHEDMGRSVQAEHKRRKCGEELLKSELAAQLSQRTLDKTLPRLGEILSAFRTDTMFEVMGNYKGVVVK